MAAFLAPSRKLQLATINRDGTPHLVTMYYVMLDGQITFWTYRSSQKALNLARDPRITCLVETGNEYFDLRGVQVQGVVRTVEDPAGVLEIGRRIAGVMAGVHDGLAGRLRRAHRAQAPRLRCRAARVISWDHGKLLPPGSSGRRAGQAQSASARQPGRYIISSVNGSRTVFSSV